MISPKDTCLIHPQLLPENTNTTNTPARPMDNQPGLPTTACTLDDYLPARSTIERLVSDTPRVPECDPDDHTDEDRAVVPLPTATTHRAAMDTTAPSLLLRALAHLPVDILADGGMFPPEAAARLAATSQAVRRLFPRLEGRLPAHASVYPDLAGRDEVCTGLTRMATWARVTTLSLASCRLAGRAAWLARSLAPCTALTDLTLSNAGLADGDLTAEVAGALAALSSLSRLSLQGNLLQGQDLQDGGGIYHCLLACPALTCLDLSDNNVRGKGWLDFGRDKHMTALTALNFQGNDLCIVWRSLYCMIRVIKHNTRLSSLQLGSTRQSRTGIGAWELSVLRRCVFKSDLALTELSLHGNSGGDQVLGDEGAEEVTLIAENCPRLTTLDLSYNRIKDVGADSLALAMRSGHFSALTALCLTENEVGDAGALELVQATQHCPRFERLALGRNRLSYEGIAVLEAAWGREAGKGLWTRDSRLYSSF